MKAKYALLLFFSLLITTKAQVGINTYTPDPSSLLDIQSHNKGLLITKVQLTSKNDITTIPSPKKGMMVINILDSGQGILKVFKNTPYLFNGNVWEELIINNTNRIDFLFPKVAAMGRKTNETTCTGLNSDTFRLETPTFVQKDNNILNTDGSIQAARKGYYAWTIQLVQKMKKDSYDPYFSPGLITYAFRTGTNTTESNQYFTFSGTVYLEENQTSQPFMWHLGDNNQVCTSTDRIGNQAVVWRYLGE